MSNFKRTVALLIAVLCLFSFAACGKKDGASATTTATAVNLEEKEIIDEPLTAPDMGENKIKIAAPADSGSLAFSKLAVDRGYAYTVEQSGMTSASAAEKIKNGEAQVAVLTLADAALLATQTDVKFIAVNTNLVLSVVASGEGILSCEELDGKTIYACGEDTYVQWVMEDILKNNGVDADIVYSTVDDIDAKMKSGEAEICILPEFHATQLSNTNEGFAKKFNLTLFWDKDYAPAATCVVARTDYIESNPENIRNMISDVEMATNSCIDNDAGVGYLAQILTGNGYFSDVELAQKAISAVGFVYLRGGEMKNAVQSNLEFYIRNGADIAVPADEAYYGV